MLWFLVIVFAYLLGSIPSGLLLARYCGLGDIRHIGSGNIGATNVLRTGKKWVALLTLLLDILKGAAAVAIAYYLLPAAAPVAAIVAVLGHNFPVWLKFKGGKGVATTIGAISTLCPPVAGLLVLSWLAIFLMTRISSLSAIVSALLAPFFACFISSLEDVLAIAILSALIVIRHRANITRLMNGTEQTFRAKK